MSAETDEDLDIQLANAVTFVDDLWNDLTKYPRGKVVPMMLKIFENIIKTQQEINTLEKDINEETDSNKKEQLQTELNQKKERLTKFSSLNDQKLQTKFHKLGLPKAYHKMVAALKGAGFEFTSDTSHLTLNEKNFGLMVEVKDMIEQRWNEQRQEYQKQANKIIAKTHEKQEKAKAEHDKDLEKIKAKIKLDHKDLSQEYKPHISSTSKDLKFGSTDVKLKFQKGGGKGGG